MHHAIVSVNLMEENVIQINGGIIINVDLSKYLANIMNGSAITCAEIIEEETKTVTSIFFNENTIFKTKNVYIFINYCSIIDNCQYLLLSDKI